MFTLDRHQTLLLFVCVHILTCVSFHTQREWVKELLFGIRSYVRHRIMDCFFKFETINVRALMHHHKLFVTCENHVWETFYHVQPFAIDIFYPNVVITYTYEMRFCGHTHTANWNCSDGNYKVSFIMFEIRRKKPV